MKPCPACRSELPDDALTCPKCGGSYQPDGGFQTPWDVEMAKQAAERERKVERAERFGALGKPHTEFFLEKKSGCLVAALFALSAGAVTLAVLVAEIA